jgi:hypothetical protein
MTTSSPSDINTFVDSTNENRVLKKLVRISGTMAVLPIPDSIIKKLDIDDDTWFEEILTSEGILLKISRRSET